MTPSINRMIRLLEEDERELVTKEKVIRLEGEIIRWFDFDFNILCPLPILERFMRLAEVHENLKIDVLTFEILKIVSSKAKFLDFKPS